MNIQNQNTLNNLLRKLAYPSKMDKKSYLRMISHTNSLLQKSLSDENNINTEEILEELNHLIRLHSYKKTDNEQYMRLISMASKIL